MTNREKQILQLVRSNTLIQQQEIAEALGISRSAVAGHIMGLINKGYIKGRGYILSEHYYAMTKGTAAFEVADYAYSPLLYARLIHSR